MSDAPALRPRALLISVGVSLALAALIYLAVVLPAEFGLDPLGTGKLLGIEGMSGVEVSALTLTDGPIQADAVEFPLSPFESVEYKYEMRAGQALVYRWRAEGEVAFDLHSEAADTDPEDAITFSAGTAASESGTYVAPYDGVHGWFWENRGAREVTVRLESNGFYQASITYSPAGEYRREIAAE